MTIDNFALYMIYLVPGIVGALTYKKHRVWGFVIGLGVAFVLITVFAFLMGV